MSANQKLNEKKTKEAIHAEVVAFLQHRSKSHHCAKCLQKEALQLRDDARNHGNIDIILILEKPSFTQLPSDNPLGKCTRELTR